MSCCSKPYIPEYLQQKGRAENQIFHVKEEIYLRCSDEDLENPFLKISIAQLSVNRQGNPSNSISTATDVLFNITDEPIERYNKKVCVLSIKSLTENQSYCKVYTEKEVTIMLTLEHDPTSCMYPHCEFRVYKNGTEVKKSDYSKFRKTFRATRLELKQELQDMITRRIIEVA
jgi:hypothetical protein